MELQFTLAGIEDIEDMVKIQCESWKHAYSGIMSDDFIERKNLSRRDKWSGILSAENTKHYIVRFKGCPIAMVSIDFPREAAEPDTYEIFGLYILPEYTGKGFGREIMLWTENKIKMMGYKKISLWVLEPNVSAKKFYEKLGFKPDGTEKLSYYDKPINLIRYTKSC